MEIETFSPQEFGNLEAYWKQLESGDDMTVFQQYNWYKNVNALYFKEKAKECLEDGYTF